MKDNNSTQISNATLIHTHSIPSLELKAVGGAIRLGRRQNSGLEEIKQQMLQSVAHKRSMESIDSSAFSDQL